MEIKNVLRRVANCALSAEHIEAPMTSMYGLPNLSALRNSLEMGLDEPAGSFASRLAVRNRVDSAQSLCQQILFKLDGLRLGDEKAIGVLAILASILSEEILRRTFHQQPGGTISIGDIAVPRSFLAKYSERIRPACLREDAWAQAGSPQTCAPNLVAPVVSSALP